MEEQPENENVDSQEVSTLKEQLFAKNEEINKLKKWMEEEGKASIYKSEQLQIENETLQHELSANRLEIDAMKSELMQITEENKGLKQDCQQNENHKKMLSVKLKDIKEDLQKTEQSLEEYYEKERKWTEIETKNVSLQKENENLKLEIKTISDRNVQFEETNNSLLNKSNERMQDLNKLKNELTKEDQQLFQLKNELKTANDSINAKNQIIDDLRQKLELKNDTDSYRPITSHFNAATLRMDEVEQFGSLYPPSLELYDMSSRSTMCAERGGFHSESPRILQEMTSKLDLLNDVKSNNLYLYDDEKQNAIDIKSKIEEYKLKQTEWDKLREEMKQKMSGYEQEIQHMQQSMDIMQRELSNRNRHRNDEDILSHDENAALIQDDDRSDRLMKKDDAIHGNGSCVLFGYPLW